jgi:hypothetical protein
MLAMHNYHSRAGPNWGNFLLSTTKDAEDAVMSSLLKSTVLSLGVLAGTAAVALAQSVSALPPSNPATAAAPSTSSSVPYAADKWQHPYSTSVGPQPGSHSSGTDQHYESTDADNDPSRHPYTGNVGPRPH